MNDKFFKVSQSPVPPADYVGPAGMKEQVLAPMTVNVPTNRGQQMAAPKNPSVQKMQEAIVNLYDSFKYYPMFNKEPNYRADQPIPQDPKAQKAEEYGENFEHGSDSFLTFLLNRYVNKSPILGKEDIKQDSKAQPINLIRLLDSLKINPDGRWGKLTNNALENIYSITQAMINVMNKLNVSSSEYRLEDLEEFKEAMQKRTPESANIITKHVAAIKRLLGSFMHAMDREGGKYSAYVRQEKPFQTNFSEQAKKFDNADTEVFRQMQARPNTTPLVLFSMPKDIGTGEGALINIPLSSLLNTQSFQNLITSNSITVNGVNPLEDVDARNKLLDYVENKIKAMQSTPAPIGSQIIQQSPF